MCYVRTNQGNFVIEGRDSLAYLNCQEFTRR